MAHWAKVNSDGVVEETIVTKNDDVDDGQSWIKANLDGTWLKTSYNTRKNVHVLGGTPFRKNYGAVGSTYNEVLDGFIPAKLDFETNFVLDEETCTWIPHVPIPEDADFIVEYGPDFTKDDAQPDSKMYVWLKDHETWGMMPNSNYPRPDNDHYWNPIDKEWQLPTDENPYANGVWDAVTKHWIELPKQN